MYFFMKRLSNQSADPVVHLKSVDILFNDQYREFSLSDQDQVEIRKSRFEDVARSGFLDLKKSEDQEIRFS